MTAPHHSSSAKKLPTAEVSSHVTAAKRRRKRAVVAHVTHGTLFAIGLALAQSDAEEVFFKKKFFEVGVLDRLQTPITRYHE